MYIQELPKELMTTTKVQLMYDCCDKVHVLKWKDADKNFKKNNGKHICRSCSLRLNNPASRKEVREKMKATCLERYGVVCALNTSENTQARVEKMFGTEEATQAIVEKRRQTSLERYGTASPIQNEEVKEKQQQAMLNKYGVRVPLQSEGIKEKMRKTCRERYGYDYPLQSPRFRVKVALRMLERYINEKGQPLCPGDDIIAIGRCPGQPIAFERHSHSS